MKNRVKNDIAFLLIGAMIFVLAGCGEAHHTKEQSSERKEGIQVMDCVGREVTLEKEAEKIVDLTMIDGVRTLVQLGAQDRVVGISNQGSRIFNTEGMVKKNYVIVSQAAPELKDLAVVGDSKEPNVEMIISLKPDVILVDSMAKNVAEHIQKQTNTPVVCVGSFGSFHYDMFRMLGKIVGKEERAEELVTFTKNKMKLVTDITAGIGADERKRLFYWTHPFAGNAPKTNGNYEAFQLAGGKNVASEGEVIPEGVYEITKEQILAWDPAFIFLHSPFKEDFEGWLTVDSVKEDEVIQGTEAFVKGNVYPIKGELSGWDMATEAAEVFYVAKILYPERFQHLDVEKEGNEILKKFYGIEGLYTDMSKQIKLYQWQ